MKKTIFTICLLLSVGLVKAQSAGEYLSEINKDMHTITESVWNYVSAAAHSNGSKKEEQKRMEVLQILKNSKDRVSKIGDFNGSTKYRDAVIHYLDLSYAVFNEDFAKLVDMEEVAEQSYDYMEAYMLAKEKANQKLKAAGDDMDVAEHEFAKDNDINLLDPEKTKISENLRISNLVYDHYNEVYLIFFKSYKQETYMWEAINKEDVSAIEQNRKALISTTTEGIGKLKKLTGYNNDPALIMSCIKLLEFYKGEAENDIPVAQEFYLQKESFTKIKTTVESKAEKDRTETDINEYNNAVKTYNEALKKLTPIYDRLNVDRGKNLNTWNSDVDKYIDKHVPK